jgi:predicted nucleotidyltransferase
MIDIEILKKEIIERLKPLDPDKIILFGSYAYGKPDDDSDIDLLLLKNIDKKEVRGYKIELRKRVRDLIFKHQIGFDFIVASEELVKNREDYFYKVDILGKGKVIYAK